MSLVNLSGCCDCPVIYNGREAQCRSCGQRDPERDRSPAAARGALIEDAYSGRPYVHVASGSKCSAPEPSADYARGRADALRDALSAVRTHWAKNAERQHVPGLRLAIETLEKMQ